MRTRRTRSLGYYIGRAFVVATVGTLLAGAPLAGQELGNELRPPSSAPDSQHLDKPAAKGSPAWLLEKHGCWSGAAPADMAGKVPGHAVVRWPNANVATYGGQQAVHAALENVFEGKHADLTVYGFCR